MEIKSIRRTNTAKLQKGSLTVEAACVMPVILLTLTGTLYFCFHVHNRAWLTSAAYESALCGSMEGIKKNVSACDAARMRSENLAARDFSGQKISQHRRMWGRKCRLHMIWIRFLNTAVSPGMFVQKEGPE